MNESVSPKTLGDVQVGAGGRIIAVRQETSAGQRIMEMGLVPGTAFRLIGTAPLGDPLEIEVRGYRLSLRRDEARQVDVELDP
jgi:Fe2+ transport system protein FeoA